MRTNRRGALLRSTARVAAAAAAVCALLARPAQAQAPDAPVPFAGIVVDAQSGAPVVRALLTLEPGGRQAMTDEAGAFRMDGVAPGVYELAVRAFGYLELTLGVAAEPGRGPFRISLAPAPVDISGLEVRGDEEVTITGIVRDAETGEPIPWASLWVTPDAQREVAFGASGEDGVFAIEEVRVGTYLLGARLAGYVPQYTQVVALPDAPPAQVWLQPDSVMRAGLEVVQAEMRTRRNAYLGIARAYGPEEIQRAGYGKALHFLTRATMLSTLVPCTGLGMCVMNRGRPVDARLIIDDRQVCGPSALDVMATYHPSEIHTFEVFRGNSVVVRAYTHAFIEREARRNGFEPGKLPPTITCMGDGPLDGPGRAPPPRLMDAPPPPEEEQ